jgi:dolichyl-phosphate-mannose-protein mannosyltransferase
VLVFLLFLLALFLLFHLSLSARPLHPIDRCCASLFLTLMSVIYAPQVSSLLLRTLSTAALVTLSIMPALGFCAYERRSLTPDHVRNAFAQTRRLIAGFFAEIFGHPYLAALFVLVAAASLLVAWVVYNFSQFGWDGWAYHTVAMAWFNQQDGITTRMPLMEFVACYPKNIEFLSLWIYRLSGNDAAVDGANLIVHFAALPFAYAIGRQAGLERHWSLAACFIYFLTPNIIVQAWSTYIDGAFADSLVMTLYFLLRWQRADEETGWLNTALLGTSLGHLAQTKGLGLYVIAIVGPFLVGNVLWTNRFRRRMPQVALVAVFTVLAGAGWYVKNWVGYGNPVFPYQVKIPGTGIVLFPGNDVSPDSLNFFGPSELQATEGRSTARNMWVLYLQQLGEVNSNVLEPDNRQGGWGVHFFLLGLPAAAVVLLKGTQQLRQLTLFGLAYFVLAPSAYWPRYSLIAPFLGALTFAFVAQEVLRGPLWRMVLRFSSVGLLGLTLAEVASIIWVDSPDAGWKLVESDINSRDGFKRFGLASRASPSRIGLTTLGVGNDNPFWYFYFGRDWRNRVEPYDGANRESYEFVICDSSGPCPELPTHHPVLTERTVTVFQRRN